MDNVRNSDLIRWHNELGSMFVLTKNIKLTSGDNSHFLQRFKNIGEKISGLQRLIENKIKEIRSQ